VLDPSGEFNDLATVFCPRRLRSTTYGTCLACPRLRSAERDAIECWPGLADCASETAPDSFLGVEVCVGEALDRKTLCTPAEVCTGTVARWLRSEGVTFAVVVDGADRFVGLLDVEAASVADGDAAVGELARRVHPVRESSPLAFAVERMVRERARALPVIDEEGGLVALLSDIGALRWVAARRNAT